MNKGDKQVVLQVWFYSSFESVQKYWWFRQPTRDRPHPYLHQFLGPDNSTTIRT